MVAVFSLHKFVSLLFVFRRGNFTATLNVYTSHLICTVIPSSCSSFAGFFFGSSTCNIPLLILAVTLEDIISSGIGMLR
jgi:hypothetical protein